MIDAAIMMVMEKKNCSGIDLNMDSKNENVINWLNSLDLFLQ